MYYECISDDEDEDDGDLLSSSLASMLFDEYEDDIIAAAMVLSRTDGGDARRNRKQKWRHTRIVWHAHVVQLHHKYLFERGHTECCTLHSQSCKACLKIGFN